MRRLPVFPLLVLGLLAAGCATGEWAQKPANQGAPGKEEASLDWLYLLQAEAELQQGFEAAPRPDCERVCLLAGNICSLAAHICALAQRHLDDEGMATMCHNAQGRCDKNRVWVESQCTCPIASGSRDGGGMNQGGHGSTQGV